MKCHRFRLVLLLALVYLLASQRLFADSIDEYIREQMKSRHIPGLVLVVLKDGNVIKQQYSFKQFAQNTDSTVA